MPHRIPRYLYQMLTTANVVVTILALFGGALVSLVILAVDESRDPVAIIDEVETDGIAIQGGRINIRFTIDKKRECDSLTVHYLEQMVPDTIDPSSLVPIRIPLVGPALPIAKATGRQKYILSLSMPSDISPSDVKTNEIWHYQNKTIRRCGLFGSLFGASVSYSGSVPVKIITSTEFQANPGKVQAGTANRPDMRP